MMSHKIKILDTEQYSELLAGDKGNKHSNIDICFASILPGLFYSVTDLIVDRSNMKYIYIPPEEFEYRYSPVAFDRIAFKKLDLLGKDVPIEDKVFIPVIVENLLIGGFYGDYEDFKDVDRNKLIEETGIADYFGMVFNAAPGPATMELSVRLLNRVAEAKSIDLFLRELPEWILGQIGEGQVGFYYKVGQEYHQRRIVGMLGDFGELPGIIGEEETRLIDKCAEMNCPFTPLGAVPFKSSEIKYPPGVRFAIKGGFDDSLEFVLVGIVKSITDYLPALFVERLSEIIGGLSIRHFGKDVEWSRILSSADKLLDTGKSYDDLAGLYLREMNDYININRISLTRYNNLENRIEILGSAQLEGEAPLACGSSYPAGGSEFEDVLESGQFVVNENRPSDFKNKMHVQLYKEGVRSYITIPIKVEGTIYGFISIGSPMAGSYLKRYIHLFEVFARYLAGVEQNRNYTNQVRVLSDQINLLEEKLTTVENMRTLGELAGGVFHDLNNSLGAILGRSQLIQTKTTRIKDEKLAEKITRDAEVIEKSAVDSGNILDRLKQVAKPRKRKERKPIELNSLVDDALEIIRPRWKKLTQDKEIKLTLKKDLKLEAVINADPSEIREVLTNILLNALDAMSEGGTISIKNRFREDKVDLYISDTGQGISEEDCRKIFDSFYTTKGEKGTGLGLSLSKKIIEEHGGSIDFRSELGQGTTFILSLPRVDKPGGEEAEDKKSGPVENPISALIVEDRPEFKDTFKELLESHGMKVRTAATGEQAIQMCGSEHFDIIITDYGLPGISGLELAHQVKSVDRKAKVILISGWEIDESIASLMGRGIDSLMTKPFRTEAILDTIKALVAERKGESIRT